MIESAKHLTVRPFLDADTREVLRLLQASLGWVPDEQYGAFFDWKHRLNPFGRSAAWLAMDGERVAGFRTFLRWEFERDGEMVRAVRAVDTATHPDYQGRGIFSRLTLHALEEMRDDGVAFVFNTPNEQSRPGYLKMGWSIVGRQPVVFRPRANPGALLRVAQARKPADKWSTATAAGHPPEEAFADDAAVERLLASQPRSDGLRTRRSVDYLRWRYGFGGLAYRVLLLGRSVEEGCCVVRRRRRGGAIEAAVCEVLVPGADAQLRRRVLRLATSIGADYAVAVGRSDLRTGFVPLPGQGPTLTWRGVVEETMPEQAAWQLTLGDVELF